jgi:hypothetical protein
MKTYTTDSNTELTLRNTIVELELQLERTRELLDDWRRPICCTVCGCDPFTGGPPKEG